MTQTIFRDIHWHPIHLLTDVGCAFHSSRDLLKTFAFPQRSIKSWIICLKLQCGGPVLAGDVPAVHRTADGGVGKSFVQAGGLWARQCMGTRGFHWNWDTGRYNTTQFPWRYKLSCGQLFLLKLFFQRVRRAGGGNDSSWMDRCK